jgi:hypothetical protein
MRNKCEINRTKYPQKPYCYYLNNNCSNEIIRLSVNHGENTGKMRTEPGYERVRWAVAGGKLRSWSPHESAVRREIACRRVRGGGQARMWGGGRHIVCVHVRVSHVCVCVCVCVCTHVCVRARMYVSRCVSQKM